jgi:hypothetical protein
MGYNISIGNARVEQDLDGVQLLAKWVVDVVTNDQAPEFPNDQVTGKSNMRMPGYSAWGDFCRESGLYRLFYGDDGLIAYHPGCAKISAQHVAEVKKAVFSWQKARVESGFTAEPGFGMGYDQILARLLWLEYWMTWAIDNCEIPAIGNS